MWVIIEVRIGVLITSGKDFYEAGLENSTIMMTTEFAGITL